MKKRIFGILFALILVLGLTVTPVVAAPAQVWYVPGDFATIQEAIDSDDVEVGDIIVVEPGLHAGALVDKSVVIKGTGGAVIDDGPLHPAGLTMGFRLLAGSDGTKISHLQFEVDLAIMNGGAVDNVTVEHCTFTDSVQAISNWEGDNWSITHNVINGLRTRCGGGIGIFIGCYSDNSTANDNLVAHNKIMGQIVVPDDDCGGYSGPGIGLMSDRRWGRAGGTISSNRILHNKVALSSTNSTLVEAVGIELTDMGLELDPPVHDLTDNKVGFNDVRGVDGTPIALYPDADEVAEENYISRNLGDDIPNRGHGLHPKILFR
jgi:hypothetical protein